MSDGAAGELDLGFETLKTVAGQFSMAGIGFVGTIIFANVLTPGEIGKYYLLMSVVGMTDRPVKGVAEAIQKRGSESNVLFGELTTLAILVALGWATVMASGAALAVDQLAAFVGFDQPLTAFISLAYGLTAFFVLEALLRASGRISQAQWLDTLRSYLTLPVQLWFLFAGIGGVGLAYGEAIGAFLIVPGFVYFLSPSLAWPSRETVVEVWRFARYSIPSEYLRHTFDRIDVLLLGALVSQTAAGNYGVVYRITVPATFVAMAVGSGLLSKASNLESRGIDVTTPVQRSLLFSSVLAFPLLAGGAVIGQPLLSVVFQPAYAEAYPLLVGLLAFQLVRSQSLPLENAISSLDRPDIVTRISASLLVTNLGFGIVLALQFGAVGVVAATVVAEVVRYALLLSVIRERLPEISLFPRELLEQALGAVLMAGVAYGITMLVPIKGWLSLVVVLSVAALTYFGTLYAVSDSLRVTVDSVLRQAGIR